MLIWSELGRLPVESCIWCQGPRSRADLCYFKKFQVSGNKILDNLPGTASCCACHANVPSILVFESNTLFEIIIDRWLGCSRSPCWQLKTRIFEIFCWTCWLFLYKGICFWSENVFLIRPNEILLTKNFDFGWCIGILCVATSTSKKSYFCPDRR